MQEVASCKTLEAPIFAVLHKSRCLASGLGLPGEVVMCIKTIQRRVVVCRGALTEDIDDCRGREEDPPDIWMETRIFDQLNQTNDMQTASIGRVVGGPIVKRNASLHPR